MARFEVRANLSRASRTRIPYLLELQANMLSALDTRLVAPLALAERSADILDAVDFLVSGI